MIVVLTETLHARPANLLVRLASRHVCAVELRRGASRADAKSILEVLSLGARKGEEIEIAAMGEGADGALRAIEELVLRGFDADLVPEVGEPTVEGIAYGLAVVVEEPSASPSEAHLAVDPSARLARAAHAAERDVDALIASLPPEEAALFEPERAILQDLVPRVAARVAAGETPESAVEAETPEGAMDLVDDARARLLARLAGEGSDEHLARALEAAPTEGELVLVAHALTPAMVAALGPRFTGIVAAVEERAASTSHAAILAHGRGLPLARVEEHVLAAIAAGERVLVEAEAGEARVWIAPSEGLVSSARARREAACVPAEQEEGSLAHLGVSVRANVSSEADAVPSCAEGIGLLRTELAFATSAAAPSEAEMRARLVGIGRKLGRGPMVVRLFDAGGDKPIAWLAPPREAPHARGIALLRAHHDVLSAQLRAIVRARRELSPLGVDVRALVPLVRGPDDLESLRAIAPEELPLGAMIETREAAAQARAIARVSDFVSLGTNDLTASVLGIARGDVHLALDPRVLRVIADVVDAVHAEGRAVTVCGEIAGDDRAAKVLVGLGIDALSVAPGRVRRVRGALLEASKAECDALAREAML